MSSNSINTFENVVKTVNLEQTAKDVAIKNNVSKEEINFVTNSTNLEELTKYLELINKQLEKMKTESMLSTIGNAILSLLGCQSANKESLESLKSLIVERINQLKYTA